MSFCLTYAAWLEINSQYLDVIVRWPSENNPCWWSIHFPTSVARFVPENFALFVRIISKFLVWQDPAGFQKYLSLTTSGCRLVSKVTNCFLRVVWCEETDNQYPLSLQAPFAILPIVSNYFANSLSLQAPFVYLPIDHADFKLNSYVLYTVPHVEYWISTENVNKHVRLNGLTFAAMVGSRFSFFSIRMLIRFKDQFLQHCILSIAYRSIFAAVSQHPRNRIYYLLWFCQPKDNIGHSKPCIAHELQNRYVDVGRCNTIDSCSSISGAGNRNKTARKQRRQQVGQQQGQ